MCWVRGVVILEVLGLNLVQVHRGLSLVRSRKLHNFQRHYSRVGSKTRILEMNFKTF
ncbi:hypothetical protein HanPSC8_Chr10g0408821 [Helianthus annuus]|nr:hypothetical protein HanPSC8_Chr10g0408821 [Helianthus annuus]